jgi:elongation factor P
MISTSDIKKGIGIKLDNRIVKIIDFLHVKPGKGGAFVRTKLKDLITGQVLDKTFRSGEKLEDIFIDKKKMQFLYNEVDEYYFMDNESYEQISISKDILGDSIYYLKENLDVSVQLYEENPIGVELPSSVELKVTQTEPGAKGNTVSGATKPATFETGLELQVPLFIEEGETIKIDTREGRYISRA